MTEDRITELHALCAEYKKKKAACEAAGLKDKATDIAADGVGRKALEVLPELLEQIRELEEQVSFLNKTAGNLAYNPCLTCLDNPHGCPRELYSPDNDDIESIIVCCRMRHARLAVEREMIAEGKGPFGKNGEKTWELQSRICQRDEGES